MGVNEFEAGRKAEEFFHRYRGHFVNTMHVGMTRTEGNVGGSDVHSLGASNFVDSGMNDGRTELKAQQSFFCKTEVKAIRNKTFLSRDNNSEEPTGTVEFEMWSNVYSERGRVPREEWTHGWMHGYIHSEEHTEELRRRNVNAVYFEFRHLDTAIEDKTVEDIRRKTGADTHFTVIPHLVTG